MYIPVIDFCFVYRSKKEQGRRSSGSFAVVVLAGALSVKDEEIEGAEVDGEGAEVDGEDFRFRVYFF